MLVLLEEMGKLLNLDVCLHSLEVMLCHLNGCMAMQKLQGINIFVRLVVLYSKIMSQIAGIGILSNITLDGIQDDAEQIENLIEEATQFNSGFVDKIYSEIDELNYKGEILTIFHRELDNELDNIKYIRTHFDGMKSALLNWNMLIPSKQQIDLNLNQNGDSKADNEA